MNLRIFCREEREIRIACTVDVPILKEEAEKIRHYAGNL